MIKPCGVRRLHKGPFRALRIKTIRTADISLDLDSSQKLKKNRKKKLMKQEKKRTNSNYILAVACEECYLCLIVRVMAGI